MSVHLRNEPLSCQGLCSVPEFLEQKGRAEGQHTLTLAGDDGEQVVDCGDEPLRARVAPQGIHQEGDDRINPWDLSF